MTLCDNHDDTASAHTWKAANVGDNVEGTRNPDTPPGERSVPAAEHGTGPGGGVLRQRSTGPPHEPTTPLPGTDLKEFKSGPKTHAPTDGYSAGTDTCADVRSGTTHSSQEAGTTRMARDKCTGRRNVMCTYDGL